VATPNDFGSRGIAPSHPELLDWLARRFVENGYSMKQLHRMLMLSRTYQLSSENDEHNHAVDADNVLLWRHNRKRLDAEQIRDTLLQISGRLESAAPTGPHPFPPQSKWNFTQHHPFKDVYLTNKRSVYVMSRRLNTLPYFSMFDGADANATSPHRDSSVTTVQALFWLNDPFFHEQALALGERLAALENDDSRIEQAFWLAMGRQPHSGERAACAAFVAELRLKSRKDEAETAREKQVWQGLARAVLRMNEFIYVD
jgi:hypothetical protein